MEAVGRKVHTVRVETRDQRGASLDSFYNKQLLPLGPHLLYQTNVNTDGPSNDLRTFHTYTLKDASTTPWRSKHLWEHTQTLSKPQFLQGHYGISLDRYSSTSNFRCKSMARQMGNTQVHLVEDKVSCDMCISGTFVSGLRTRFCDHLLSNTSEIRSNL